MARLKVSKKDGSTGVRQEPSLDFSFRERAHHAIHLASVLKDK